MKMFRFYADCIIEAESLEEAEEIFTNNSFDFAQDAEVEEVDPKTHQPLE